jgi:hypothetical protein
LENLRRERSTPLGLGESCIFHRKELTPEVKKEMDKFRFPDECFMLRTPARPNEQSVNTLDRALTVFKLFKEGLVLSNLAITEGQKVELFPHYFHWIEEGKRLEPYFLTTAEEQEFTIFWKEFSNVPPTNFSVYRFHLADFRPYLADRFVDYVESLEYLLVPDSGQGEIRYKLSSRGAQIIGLEKTAGERECIYHQLKDAYDLRSALVHGDQNKAQKLRENREWAQILQSIRAHDRAVIKFFARAACLDDPEKRRQLLEKKLIFEARTT